MHPGCEGRGCETAEYARKIYSSHIREVQYAPFLYATCVKCQPIHQITGMFTLPKDPVTIAKDTTEKHHL
jgi:hypothetical protein